MAHASVANSFGWSQYPTRVTVDEKGRVDREQFDRLNEQLNAVCEVHAATSNALSAAEAANIKVKQELERVEAANEVLREQNSKLCREQQEQDTQHQALKDKCIDAHDKLGRLVEYQVERGDLLRQSREQQQLIKQLEQEASERREQLEKRDAEVASLREAAERWQRQTEAQLRCNELITQECSRLKRTLSKNGEKRMRTSHEVDDLGRELGVLEKKLQKAEKEVARKGQTIADLEDEASRLKRERISALRALQDEQDRAKERELWLRTLRRDNMELREELARVANMPPQPSPLPGAIAAAAADDPCTSPAAAKTTPRAKRHKDKKRGSGSSSDYIPCVQVGHAATAITAAPPNELLVNLKQQSKLQLKCLTNTVAQLIHTMDKREAHAPRIDFSRS